MLFFTVTFGEVSICILKNIIGLLKKEPMLSVSLAAAILSLFITPPTTALLGQINWHTLATLFMMLSVLEGFKKEDIFRPVIHFAGRITRQLTLSLFLVFAVFFSSMFVTNDVSLIIFVPLTILLFRAGNKEHYILPVISMENIAAVRGSMLMPFGSPQNLYIFNESGMTAGHFILHMAPLSAMSAVLLCIFLYVLYRKNPKETIHTEAGTEKKTWDPARKKIRIAYLLLFALILFSIVSRTEYWPYITVFVGVCVFLIDREILTKRVDYVLLFTFLCFFVFSSSICANPTISDFLTRKVAGHEYFWSIALSQLISNVPASIVLYPFTTNVAALLYGLDSAGLVSLIGSLASVINYRIYVREYPQNGMKFILTFTLISLCFFAIVVIPGWLLSSWPM